MSSQKEVKLREDLNKQFELYVQLLNKADDL